MASAKLFLKSGHPPTLLAAFLYFDFSFAVWVLNGAMGPFISEAFKLSAAQTGFMVSVPTLAGAFMRFPLGVLSQYIGRKNAAIVEMSMILAAMCYGYFFVRSFNDVLAMGVLLGIAGASFGVALSLGSGWFPPQYKGLAMGIAGAGNSGTVLATLFAPILATKYGWHQVYGFAGLMMLLPLGVMIFFAKEPPDREHQSFKEHIACLWEKDGWVFNLVYIITFGGFIGLSTFLPSFFYAQFHVSKIQAGQLTTLAAIMGSALRVVGGWVSDRIGGIATLSVVLLMAIGLLLLTSTAPSLVLTTLLFMLCFSSLGMGNGALFQLVPLRWPLNTAVAGSMIGEIGALGGAILPNAMGLSKTYTGSFATGFVVYSILAAAVLLTLRFAQKGWVGRWVGKGGKPLEVPSVLTTEGATAAGMASA
jgi:NNP family nitrate/nitrite transporter-like MFS transporter